MSRGGRYPHLFAPLQVGPLRVDNRVVFNAHTTNYAEDGLPGARHAAYYAARARGGAGLLIAEEQAVHPTGVPSEKLLQGFRPDIVPRYRAITETVHAQGVAILAQLNHLGGHTRSGYSRRPLWAPSPVADPMFREVPKAVERQEISEIIDGYGLVADHCVEGGFDGIELQAAHSSIVRGFLSPVTNRRSDRYGGSLRNRARLLIELINEVRRCIGATRVLGVRLCGDEFLDGGTTLDEAVAVARMVEDTGKVDYLNTTVGSATTTLRITKATMHVPAGYGLFVPNAIRRAVELPVVGGGRFTDPSLADRALAEGHCDLVGIVRGQIADAELVAKARSGQPDTIRGCLSCNQECVGRVERGQHVGCVANPHVGHEPVPSHAAPFLPVPSPRRGESAPPAPPHQHRLTRSAPLVSHRGRGVLVAGAGPAGLQAAIAAARAGHRVRVWEREAQAGGQVRLAATVPNRAQLGDLIRGQLAECRRNGVSLSYNAPLDTAAVRGEAPDVLVVATGACPERPRWAGTHTRVVDVSDVMVGTVRPEGTVLVVDELGFHQATSVAELLADRGCAVEVATPNLIVGQDLRDTLDLEHWCVRAAAKGITQTHEHTVVEVATGGPHDERLEVTLLHHPTEEQRSRHVDWVVCAVPQAPVDGLYRELRHSSGIAVFRAGDCVAPRRAHAAVLEGERIGTAL